MNEKCVFAMESIRFLGQLVIAYSVALYPNKVRAVFEMVDDRGGWKLKSDVMANYLSKFFPNLASYTHPLKYLFREKNEWCWGTPQKGFSEIKIRSQQVLASFSPTTEAHISADATSFEQWGILSQSRGRTWKPIVFALWI